MRAWWYTYLSWKTFGNRVMSPPDGVMDDTRYFKTDEIKKKSFFFFGVRHRPFVYHPWETKKLSFIDKTLYSKTNVHQGGRTPQLKIKTNICSLGHARPIVKPAKKRESPQNYLLRISLKSEFSNIFWPTWLISNTNQVLLKELFHRNQFY